MNIKSSIIDYARKIGIECIGFTNTVFSEEFCNRLRFKREKNLLSGFEESDENKRVNTDDLLKGARSIISIALPYKYRDQNYFSPYVSKYTLGEDYHRVLTIKLELLKKYIEDNYDEKSLIFCDTGVLSDKEVARKSGIGFQGKNTNIITKKYGSYVFLGEVLTTLEIEQDIEKKSLCMNCNKCIVACPANALSENGLDSKKCLSYITQKKEDLTNEEINTLGLRIFGCDTCQDVCPFNKEVSTSSIEEFKPLDILMNMDLEEILSMSNKEFKFKYGKHALSWRGKYIIQRNLIIAVGNSKNKEYIKILQNKKHDLKLKKYIDISIEKLNEL